MGHYLLKDSPKTGTGDLLISVQTVNPIRIPLPQSSYDDQPLTDEQIYSMYDLSQEEIAFIESQI